MTDAPTSPVTLTPDAPTVPVTQSLGNVQVGPAPAVNTTTPTTIIAPTPPATATITTGPDVWNHISLIIGALILVASVLLNSFRPLAATDWTIIGVAAAALGVKGTTGILG